MVGRTGVDIRGRRGVSRSLSVLRGKKEVMFWLDAEGEDLIS